MNPRRGWGVLTRWRQPTLQDQASFVALDFGTTASTISILPEAADYYNIPDELAVKDASPWSLSTIIGDPDDQGTLTRLPEPYTGSPLTNGFPVVPVHIEQQRVPVSFRGKRAVPSLLYALQSAADGTGTGESVTVHPENAIGWEADTLMENLSKLRGTRPDRLLFAPKRLVGFASEMIREERSPLRHFLRFREEIPPVELYLQELIDQAVHTSMNSRVTAAGMNPPMKKRIARLCYSYPVTWVRGQREAFRKHLESVVKLSFAGNFICAESRDSVVDPELSMDEASAAFLGVVHERFRGLEGVDLVRAFEPFNPETEAASAYPKQVDILVVDCGGGTTDVALVELIDHGESMRFEIEAHVAKHFAIDRGGVEVTRQIAEYLKALLYQEGRNQGKTEEELVEKLRSNLSDREIDSDEALLKRRQEFTLALFREAERLKIEVSGKGLARIQWHHLSNLSGLAVPSRETTLRREDVVRWVRETYQVAVSQIARWFDSRSRKLDMVVLSGRSGFLPGLEEEILGAIPRGVRPLQTDFAKAGNYSFDPRKRRTEEETSKNLVCAGLALNYWNRIGGNASRPIKCHPINERLRTRAFGILQVDIGGRVVSSFSAENLLVEPDNKPILPGNESVFAIQTGSRGFWIGVNFSGQEPDGDPPQPFMQVRIEGGRGETGSRLVFVFHHVSTTDFRLKRVELHEAGSMTQKRELPTEGFDDGRDVPIIPKFRDEIEINGLKIFLNHHPQIEDFRITGRIHLTGNALDSDR
jgi:hypothetical protein